MLRFAKSAFVVFVVMILCGEAFAQASGGAGAAISNSGAVPMGNHMGTNNMTQEQFNQLKDYVDQAKRLTKDERVKGKTEADLRAEDKENAAALAKNLAVPCEVSDAMLVAQGNATVAGKPVQTRSYETACTNGVGYFLVLQEPKPYALSCFAAEAKTKADAAAGIAGGAMCKLPANADSKAMAAAILSRAGKPCSVTQVGWIGQNASTNTEYNEAVCADGTGYMLASALPGSANPPRVTDCHTSAMQGIICKLAHVEGAPIVTIQTFKDAIAQRGISCEASNVRVIGQQNISKRYVVEFACPQQPRGLVAFIPVGENAAPFQTYDCAAAAKVGAVCKLTGN
jgi:hypothetical protein